MSNKVRAFLDELLPRWMTRKARLKAAQRSAAAGRAVNDNPAVDKARADAPPAKAARGPHRPKPPNAGTIASNM